MVDAEVPEHDMLGNEGEGWRIAGTTLSKERRGFSGDRTGGPLRERTGPIYEEYRKELAIDLEPYVWYPQREGRVDLVMQRARDTGAIKDAAVRQEIAKLLSMKQASDLASAVAEQTRRAGSNEIIPAGSIGKLAASNIARQASHVHTMISGADAMLSGPDSTEGGIIAEVLISVPAISIAGGTDEIQKNIVSERVLGMPKEPRADTGPFRDIPRNVES